MAKMRECPECGISVKLENLESHIRKVHPRVDVKSLLSEDDKTDILIAKKKKKKTGRPFDDHERKRWALAGSIVVVIALVVIFVVAAMPPPGSGGNLVGKPAPLFVYNDVDNQRYVLNDHIGPRLILLEFFYTQCSWCIQMHPNIQELYAHYGWGDKLDIVSISANSDDSFEDVRNYRDTHGSNWTFISAPESLGETYQVTGTPTMYLIDYKGIVVEKIYGYKSVDSMEEIIDSYL